MRELRFGTLNARGIKKISHNDGSLSLKLSNIINDTNQNKLDAIAVQESHFGEYEYLQQEDGYISYFVNESQNRYHGTGIMIFTNQLSRGSAQGYVQPPLNMIIDIFSSSVHTPHMKPFQIKILN